MQTIDCEILFRPANDQLRYLPEGPIDIGGSRFSWVAIQHGADAEIGSINIYDMSTGRQSMHELSGRPGFAFPTNEEGVFVIGAERTVGRYDSAADEWTELASDIDSDVENTIINDGVQFSGGLIFGTKDLEFATKKAGLYVMRDGQQPVRLRSDQLCSNGKVILQDDDPIKFLDIDSPTKTVVEYTLDGDSLSDPRVVLDLRDGEDVPDGMVGTPDGRSVIIAFYNPNEAPHGEARQYSLVTGEVECIWKTDVAPQVTCPLLIEHNGRVKLVLTTAVDHMPAERLQRHPNSGCLFIGETQFLAT
jgi:sugar lactone lactonase YvrE